VEAERSRWQRQRRRFDEETAREADCLRRPNPPPCNQRAPSPAPPRYAAHGAGIEREWDRRREQNGRNKIGGEEDEESAIQT